MLPIPMRLLIHSAELITKYDGDKWGAPSETETIPLDNIRIEYSKKKITDRNGTYIGLSAILFFDGKNSSPHDVRFALEGDIIGNKRVCGQQIKFGGHIFTVRNIEPFYADSRNLHHYEIGLV